MPSDTCPHCGAPGLPIRWDGERIKRLEEQLESTQRILVEERRWISDARDWYRDHRSSKGGIYDEGTWGDPFAVPGEAEVPASSADLSESSGATATSPVSSPELLAATRRVARAMSFHYGAAQSEETDMQAEVLARAALARPESVFERKAREQRDSPRGAPPSVLPEEES